MEKIFVLGGNWDQLEYIRKLKRDGYEIILTDINEQAPAREFADKFRCIGYENTEELIEYSKEVKISRTDKVFTSASQFAHKGASAVAQANGIKYPKPEVIETCLDKIRYYEWFSQNGLLIPKTQIIRSEKELRAYLNTKNTNETIYLKSDFSKNPKHVYRLDASNVNYSIINWKKDTHLRSAYVLQPEVKGRCLRINVYGGELRYVFDFDTGERVDSSALNRQNLSDFLQKLRNVLSKDGLNKWWVKFDVITTDDGIYVLDIGIDPPTRLKRYLEAQGEDFVAMYLQWTLGK